MSNVFPTNQDTNDAIFTRLVMSWLTSRQMSITRWQIIELIQLISNSLNKGLVGTNKQKKLFIVQIIEIYRDKMTTDR